MNFYIFFFLLNSNNKVIEQHIREHTIHGLNEKQVRDYILNKKVKIYAFAESVFPEGEEDPMTWLAVTLGISSTTPEHITTYRVLSPGELNALYGLYSLALMGSCTLSKDWCSISILMVGNSN